MPQKARVCGKMYSKGRVFDVCNLPVKHEGAHRAPNRGFTFSDNGGVEQYDKPAIPHPRMDLDTAREPDSALPEPAAS